jgi:very-short-patch-repair endonuclease
MGGIRFNQAQLSKILEKGHCRVSVELKPNKARSIVMRTDRTPQEILWDAVSARWNCFVPEYRPIPTRRFRIDIAHPEKLIAIECDGWQFHAKYKADFQRDRQRQNLLTEHGWSFLRFTAGEIINNLDECLQSIERALCK